MNEKYQKLLDAINIDKKNDNLLILIVDILKLESISKEQALNKEAIINIISDIIYNSLYILKYFNFDLEGFYFYKPPVIVHEDYINNMFKCRKCFMTIYDLKNIDKKTEKENNILRGNIYDLLNSIYIIANYFQFNIDIIVNNKGEILKPTPINIKKYKRTYSKEEAKKTKEKD